MFHFTYRIFFRIVDCPIHKRVPSTNNLSHHHRSLLRLTQQVLYFLYYSTNNAIKDIKIYFIMFINIWAGGKNWTPKGQKRTVSCPVFSVDPSKP